MISLWRIFWLEVVALVRSWTALMLLVASLGWMFAANFVLVTDATEEGKREMLVRYGLGGVFVLLIVAVLAAATGLIASEREFLDCMGQVPCACHGRCGDPRLAVCDAHRLLGVL